MATWQFWTLIAIGFLFCWDRNNRTEKLKEATYRVAQLIIELTDQVKLMQGNTFQIERHTETLEREALRD